MDHEIYIELQRLKEAVLELQMKVFPEAFKEDKKAENKAK